MILPTGAGDGPVDARAGIWRGLRLPLDALALLRAERSLRLPALAPFLLSLAAFAGGVGAVIGWAGPMWGFVTGWMPALEAGAWIAWLWIGPAKLLFGALGAILFLLTGAVIVAVAFLLANLLASPFHDLLSRRVEAARRGRVDEAASRGWVADAARALLEEAKRLAVFLPAQGALLATGLLVPGAQPFAAAAMAVLAGLFLAFDYTSYSLDRRGLRFGEKIRWARRNPGAVAGFAAACLFLCSVPGLNLLALPVLVTAGTLLTLEAR